MEICSHGHHEICHSEMKCPLCESIEEMDDKRAEEVLEIENLLEEEQGTVEELRKEIADLEKSL